MSYPATVFSKSTEGLTTGAALNPRNRVFYPIEDDNIPLVDVPSGIQFNWTGADAIYPNPNKTAIQPMTGIRFPQPDEIRIPCPVAVPIMNHYVQRAFPIKTTLRWMD